MEWTGSPSMAASRFPTPHGSSTPAGAPSTRRCATPTASSPGSWRASARSTCPRIPKPAEIAKWEHAKAGLQAAIGERRATIAVLKAERKAVGRHIGIGDLPPEDRFQALHGERKHFVDTLKMIACRAETAMASLARESMRREDDARSLMRQIYGSAADLVPDPEAGTLTVRLHRLTAQVHDEVVARLCGELTATETVFPGTELRLVFPFVGSSQFL